MHYARLILAWCVQAIAVSIALPAMLLMFIAERCDDFADDLWDRWT